MGWEHGRGQDRSGAAVKREQSVWRTLGDTQTEQWLKHHTAV